MDKQQKQNIGPPTRSILVLTAYSFLPQNSGGIFSTEMTAKNDHTISCSHLVLETSAVAGQKILKAVVTTPEMKVNPHPQPPPPVIFFQTNLFGNSGWQTPIIIM